jgi:hypothetical protein
MPLLQTRFVLGLAAGLTLVGWPQLARAQNAPAPVPVKFETVDQVEIHGTFYPGAKAEKGAAILLLHNIGVGFNSKNEGWEALALKLQANGHSVLAFDFRGHGQSTTVTSEFWKYGCNMQLVKGYKPDKTTISAADFHRAYYPVLVNDIAAAKIFLDRRNNNKEGNSSNVILVGAQEGAALGALWLNGEWYRYRIIQTDPFTGRPIRWENTSEGKKVYACLWLSMTSSIGSFNPQVSTWLEIAAKKNQVPMGFFYGDQDPAARAVATACVSRLTSNGKENTKFIKAVPIKGAKAAGSGLLKPNVGTDVGATIAETVEGLLKLKINQDWAESDQEKVGYVWSWTPGNAIIAKTEGEKYFRMFRVDYQAYRLNVPGLPPP